MAMNITLTPEIEAALTAQARRLGVSPEELALESLRRDFVPVEPTEQGEAGETLADFLGDAIGSLHSSEFVPGGARMSENTGAAFTRILEEKRRQGRL